jgi:DNA-binding transcriptional LysR family regulator
MTLQQLNYIIEIANTGSISRAAENLFVTQPSISKAVVELEKEFGITIFCRSNHGVYLSEDGSKFLSYARQVVEQAEVLKQHYDTSIPVRRVFAVSSQHYAFVVNAFVNLVKEYGCNEYEFTLRESRTYDIIEDVRTRRSAIGVLYLSDFNRAVMLKMIKNAELRFTSLFTAAPHVFLSRRHPLMGKKSVSLEELKPYPRLTFEQGIQNSFYFAEELCYTEGSPKNVIVTDRATLFNLLIGLNGYTISSGILSSDLNGSDIISIPLESSEKMEIGFVYKMDETLDEVSTSYIEHLKSAINKYQK